MDILWLAVRITIKLLITFIRATAWMFKKALPWAQTQGEMSSQNINMSWYPFPFGNLAVEMCAIWFVLATLIGLAMSRPQQSNVVPALFLGLFVLPLFLGFGLGFRKPPLLDQPPVRLDPTTRLSADTVNGDSVAPTHTLPTLDSLGDMSVQPTPVMFGSVPLTTVPQSRISGQQNVGNDTGLPTLASLESTSLEPMAQREVGSMTQPDQLPPQVQAVPPTPRYTDDEHQVLMEAPEILIYAVMRLGGKPGPIQVVQESGAAAMILAQASDSPNELIRTASKWHEFGTIEQTSSEMLPEVALEYCQRVNVILAAKGATIEAAEYRAWLLTLARHIANAASEQGIGGEKISADEEQFLAQVASALGQ